jgi:hypothetical protein
MVFAQSVQAEAVKLERQSTAEMPVHRRNNRQPRRRKFDQEDEPIAQPAAPAIRPRDVFDERNHEMDQIVSASVLFVENFSG